MVCVVFLYHHFQEVHEMVGGTYERAVAILTENSSKLKEVHTYVCRCVCVCVCATAVYHVQFRAQAVWPTHYWCVGLTYLHM